MKGGEEGGLIKAEALEGGGETLCMHQIVFHGNKTEMSNLSPLLTLVTSAELEG